MRSYLIDEISASDMERVRHYLEEHTERSPIQDLFWLPLGDSFLTEIQQQHVQCQPFYVAIELGRSSVKFELLVRSRVSFRCGCTQYAEDFQRDFVVGFAERLIRELRIRT
jgi:hypothetical protein